MQIGTIPPPPLLPLMLHHCDAVALPKFQPHPFTTPLCFCQQKKKNKIGLHL